MGPTNKSWYVYMVRCSDGTIYTGITNDIEARIAKHNNGSGARYTAQRRPVKLVHTETLGNRSNAMKREAQIKRWNRRQKESLLLKSKSAGRIMTRNSPGVAILRMATQRAHLSPHRVTRSKTPV